MLAAGEFVDAEGAPVGADAPFVPRSVVWAHRDLPDEAPLPSDVSVLHRDERLVVVDKPHHMATMPRGSHVVQSALARARVLTGLPRLAPAHRLDRPTAGVLMLTTEQRWRGAYQQVFARGLARKTYLAVARVRPDLELPLVRRTHLVKEHGTHQAREVPGAPPNAETLVELVDAAGDLGPLSAHAPHRPHPPAALPAVRPRSADRRRPALSARPCRRGRRLHRVAPAAGRRPRVRRPRRRPAPALREPPQARRVAGGVAEAGVPARRVTSADWCRTDPVLRRAGVAGPV